MLKKITPASYDFCIYRDAIKANRIRNHINRQAKFSDEHPLDFFPEAGTAGDETIVEGVYNRCFLNASVDNGIDPGAGIDHRNRRAHISVEAVFISRRASSTRRLVSAFV